MTSGNPTAAVLIIDDDKVICDWITNVVTQLGHRAVSAHLLREGLKKLQSEPFDIVFVDVHLPDGDGLEILPKIKAARSSPETIVITALGHPDEAELAIRSGAWDYLEKPASFDAIKFPIIRALEYRSERKPGNGTVLKRNGIIGDSPRSRPAWSSSPRPRTATPTFSSPARPAPGKSCSPRSSMRTAAGPKRTSWSSTVRRSPRRSSKAFCSGTRGGLLPGPRRAR